MAAIALCNFVRTKNRTGSYISGRNYQNFFISKNQPYNGISYKFAPFAFNQNAGTRGGDRSDCALILGLNDIAVNFAHEIAESERLLEVKTVEVDVSNFAIGGLISLETWRVAGYEVDDEKVVIRLQSPLDAVGNLVPSRVLTSSLCGALPTTSNV